MLDFQIFFCSVSPYLFCWGNPRIGRLSHLFSGSEAGPIRCTCPSFWILREWPLPQGCWGAIHGRGISFIRCVSTGSHTAEAFREHCPCGRTLAELWPLRKPWGLLLFVFWCLFERERERERERENMHAWAGEWQRQRERETPKPTPCYQHRARHRAPSQEPWDRDLSQNQESDTSA